MTIDKYKFTVVELLELRRFCAKCAVSSQYYVEEIYQNHSIIILFAV